MSRKYVRSTLQASWSENGLNEAMEKVKSKTMGVTKRRRIYIMYTFKDTMLAPTNRKV